MKTIIIGGGFAGLSAALKLKGDFLILEKEKRAGGLCRTEIINGFIFDYTGHLLHLNDKKIEKFIFSNIKVKLNKVKRKAYVFSNNVYTNYPYQINNFGLPPKIIEQNLVGFIRMLYSRKKNINNFKEWVINHFGKGIAKNFMFPYNEKLWKYSLHKLTTKWLGRFVPSTTLDDILNGLVSDKSSEAGYNAYFYYPEKGGIESIIRDFYEKIKNKVILNAEVKKVDIKKKIVYYNKHKAKYDSLLVTMSLKEFLKIIDSKVTKYAEDLKATSVYALNIGYRETEKVDKSWVYVPEKKYSFYRIGFPHTFSLYNAPKGFNSVYTEVSFKKTISEKINKKIINDLLKMQIIKNKKNIKVIYPMILKNAYVIYDKERERILPEIENFLENQNIYLAGRWAKWEYSSMEDAIREGIDVAEKINRRN